MLRFVPVGSIADIQRCFEFRVGLEGAAAALAAERREPSDLAEIKAALAALEDSIRENRLGTEENERFHMAVARATHNGYYVSVLDSLQPHVVFGMNLTRSLSLLRTAERLRLVQDEHIDVAAIEARDGARAAMETHIENAPHRMFEGAPAKRD